MRLGCKRVILDLPSAIRLAIRLRATKSRLRTAQIVERAIRETFPEDVKDAERTIAERKE